MAKYGRDIFLYMDPTGAKKSFAQCGACRLFVPGQKGKKGACVIHGADLAVDEDDSCGLFVAWGTDGPEEATRKAQTGELQGGNSKAVTPAESGFVRREVQCGRCKHFEEEKSSCEFFAFLNKTAPSDFKLDTKVNEHGCCNGWQSGGTKSRSRNERWYDSKKD